MPQPYYSADRVTLYLGDCVEVMRALPDASVDAIVTDPPYELGFMGKGWDASGIANSVEMWREAYRVLKPGGHLAAFGGTRTYHRMACAVEDAGFEIRDTLSWNFGSGFPKSLNVSRALDGKRCDCPIPLPTSEGASGDSLHGLRNDVPHASEPSSTGAGADLLTSVQRSEQGEGLGSPWAQRICGEDAGEPSEVSDVRPSKSGVEGRGDILQDARELHGRPLRPSAGLGEADGAGGRLHHGAPAGDGRVVRLPADADGGGEPYQPRSVAERADEHRTLADERRSQASGVWPLCAGCGKPIVIDGLGTALKPAYEPIVLARKPLIGTVAANVLAHGTGALNIDGTRIGTEGEIVHAPQSDPANRTHLQQAAPNMGDKGDYQAAQRASIERTNTLGRWPANVLLDEEAAALLDQQTGDLGVSAGTKRDNDYSAAGWGKWGGLGTYEDGAPLGYGDTGGASRFFFVSRGQEWSRNVHVVSDAGIQCASCGTVTALSPAPTSRETAPPETRGQDSTESSASFTQPPSHVSSAELQGDTAITLTTPNFCGSCGSALGAIGAPINSASAGVVGAGNAQELATRFRYTSKASRGEREAGVDAQPARRSDGRAKDIENPRLRTNERANDHPTVKPIDVMRWLCRLVTPPGGTILDPFLGSGTTALAALDDGFQVIGIEREERYMEIAQDRVTHRHLLEVRTVEAAEESPQGRLL